MARSARATVEQARWGWLVLLASSTTLVCCALPILLVSIGLGAVSAAMFANVSGLTFLAAHKGWLFAGSGVSLALGAWTLFRPGRSCPADPALAAKCEAAHRWNVRALALSAAIWAIGFSAAYLSVPLLELSDRIAAR